MLNCDGDCVFCVDDVVDDDDDDGDDGNDRMMIRCCEMTTPSASAASFV